MINEARTFEDFGYTSDELTSGTPKHIWAICDICGDERSIRYKNYVISNGRCHSCANSNPSEETRRKLSERQIGVKNHNYNHNLTNEDRIKRRFIFGNKQWSLNIKKRDNFTCQKCNLHDGNLISYYILGYSTHPDSRYDLDNGITLCEDCHKQFHHLYGYKYFTDNDFFTWVILDE